MIVRIYNTLSQPLHIGTFGGALNARFPLKGKKGPTYELTAQCIIEIFDRLLILKHQTLQLYE